MRKSKLFTACIFAATFSLGMAAYAEEPTAGEKMENAGNKVSDAAQDGVDTVKDKTCEMVNGKMECAGKKVKHKVEKGMRKAKTKGTELKNEHN